MKLRTQKKTLRHWYPLPTRPIMEIKERQSKSLSDDKDRFKTLIL